jgi:hypothetical protein
LTWLAYDPNDVRPGWGALLLMVALLVATYFLWRSMNTQLGKIQMPPSSRPSAAGQAAESDEGERDDKRPPAPPSN